MVLAPETGLTSVPGPLGKRHELDYGAITPNEQVGRYFHATNFPEIRVRVPVECVREQCPDFGAAKFAGREADPVYDDHRRLRVAGSRILVRAAALSRWLQQTGGFVYSEEA